MNGIQLVPPIYFHDVDIKKLRRSQSLRGVTQYSGDGGGGSVAAIVLFSNATKIKRSISGHHRRIHFSLRHFRPSKTGGIRRLKDDGPGYFGAIELGWPIARCRRWRLMRLPQHSRQIINLIDAMKSNSNQTLENPLKPILIINT